MAKYLLITLAILFTAFSANEVLGAARYRRDTTGGSATATGSGSSTGSANNSEIDLVLNVTLVFPNVTQNIARLREAIKNGTAQLSAAFANAENRTADAVNNTIAALIKARDTLRNETSASLVQLRNDLNQTIITLQNNAQQLQKLVAERRAQLEASAQQRAEQLRSIFNSTVSNLTAAIQQEKNEIQRLILLTQLAVVKGFEGLIKAGSQSQASLVAAVNTLQQALTASGASGSKFLASLISALQLSASGSFSFNASAR